MRAQSVSWVWLLETPWTVACQTPLPMEFPRQEYWSGLPSPPPGDLQTQGVNSHLLHLLHWQTRFFPTVPLGTFTDQLTLKYRDHPWLSRWVQWNHKNHQERNNLERSRKIQSEDDWLAVIGFEDEKKRAGIQGRQAVSKILKKKGDRPSPQSLQKKYNSANTWF